MQDIHRFLWIAVGTIILPVGAVAQQPVRWQPTLESAKCLAAQTDRLVLIHFWADWCQTCRRMEREVFSQPGVASSMEANYVPVNINADYFPAIGRQYGVTALPADIIITPQGRQIDKLQGLTTASQYVARLNQTATAMRRHGIGTYGQIPTGSPSPTAGRAGPPQNTAAYQSAGAPTNSDRQYADYSSRQREAQGLSVGPRPNSQLPVNAGAPQQGQAWRPGTGARQAQPGQRTAPSATAGPALQPPAGQAPSANPPLGLGGYCPVQLSDDMNANVRRWTLGDRRWGVIHRGRTYLFAGPEQQRRFLADPDRYAPVLSGDDVVMAVEQGQAVGGRREHGVLFGSKVYLFASEASLEKFGKNPDHYADRVLQAMQAAAGTSSRSVY